MNDHGRLLARAGIILFALSLLTGMILHSLPFRDQALAAHIAGLLASLFLISLALLWQHLNLSASASRLGVLFALYGFYVGWTVNIVAAATGVFGVFPVSAGQSLERIPADFLMSAVLLSVAIADLSLAFIVFRGLRSR